MKAEGNDMPKVVATGGLATLLSGVSETIDFVEPNLTLEGLKIIHRRNGEAARS